MSAVMNAMRELNVFIAEKNIKVSKVKSQLKDFFHLFQTDGLPVQAVHKIQAGESGGNLLCHGSYGKVRVVLQRRAVRET